MYYVECDCGKDVAVELFQAGTTVACQQCNATIGVPNTTVLKELSGDKYPLLSPIEKIIKTASEGEPPFNGMCHRCGENEANWQIPIQFDVMQERHIQDGGGIRPSLTGVTLVVAASEETWKSVTFPLLLCAKCSYEFEKVKSRATSSRITRNLIVVGLLAAFLYFAFNNPAVIIAFLGIISVIGCFSWAVQFRDTTKGALYVLPWLDGIRWVPEVIAAEDEYRLSVGTCASYDPPKTP